MELNTDLKKIRNLIMWNLPLTLKLNPVSVIVTSPAHMSTHKHMDQHRASFDQKVCV